MRSMTISRSVFSTKMFPCVLEFYQLHFHPLEFRLKAERAAPLGSFDQQVPPLGPATSLSPSSEVFEKIPPKPCQRHRTMSTGMSTLLSKCDSY